MLFGAAPASAQSVETFAVTVAGEHDPASSARAIEVVRAGLSRRAGARLVAPDVEARLFRSPAPKAIEPPLTSGKKSVKRAERAFGSFKLDEARQHLEAAEKALDPWVGTPEARDLLRERLVLAVSVAHAERDTQGLERAVVAYARLFPGEPPPKGAPWPPAVAQRLAKVQPELDAALRVETTPQAMVYIDGKPAGNSPVELTGLTRGEHRLIVEAPAHYRSDQTVVALAGAEKPLIKVELAPSLSADLMRVSVEKGVPPRLGAPLRSIAETAKIDRIFLVEPLPNDGVTIRRFDVRAPGPDVERVSLAKADGAEIDRALEQLLVGLAPEAPVAAATSVEIPAWAWIGLGAGAVALGAGTAFRLDAVGTQNDVLAQDGALTQARAFELRDDADSQAFRGTILLGAGAAAIVGVGGWIAYKYLSEGP